MAILDWMLPGITGLELCRRMRSTPGLERTLVIVLTGRVEPDDLDQVLAAGADDYWTKPIDAQRLRIRLGVAERQAQTIAQRGRAEDALRASVERFELAALGTNDGIFDGPLRGDDWFSPDAPIWFSARYKALLGFDEDDFPNIRGSWIDRIHPDDRQRVFAALSDHLTGRTPYDIEYRLQMKSGEYRWFSGRAPCTLGQPRAADTAGRRHSRHHRPQANGRDVASRPTRAETASRRSRTRAATVCLRDSRRRDPANHRLADASGGLCPDRQTRHRSRRTRIPGRRPIAARGRQRRPAAT